MINQILRKRNYEVNMLEKFYKKYLKEKVGEMHTIYEIELNNYWSLFKNDLIYNSELMKDVLGKEDSKILYDTLDFNPLKSNSKQIENAKEKINELEQDIFLNKGLPQFTAQEILDLKIYKKDEFHQYLQSIGLAPVFTKEDIHVIFKNNDDCSNRLIKQSKISSFELNHILNENRREFLFPKLDDFEQCKLFIIISELKDGNYSNNFVKRFASTLKYKEVLAIFEQFEDKNPLVSHSLFKEDDAQIAELILKNYPSDKTISHYEGPHVSAVLHKDLVLKFLEGKKFKDIACDIDKVLTPVEILEKFNIFSHKLLSKKNYKENEEIILKALNNPQTIYTSFYQFQNETYKDALEVLLKNENFFVKFIDGISFSRDHEPNEQIKNAYAYHIKNNLERADELLTENANARESKTIQELIQSSYDALELKIIPDIEDKYFRFTNHLHDLNSSILRQIKAAKQDYLDLQSLMSFMTNSHVQNENGLSIEKMYQVFEQQYPGVLSIDSLQDNFYSIISGKYKDFFIDYIDKEIKKIPEEILEKNLEKYGLKNLWKKNKEKVKDFSQKNLFTFYKGHWNFQYHFEQSQYIQPFNQFDEKKFNFILDNLYQINQISKKIDVSSEEKNRAKELLNDFFKHFENSFENEFSYYRDDIKESIDFLFIRHDMEKDYHGSKLSFDKLFKKMNYIVQKIETGKYLEGYELHLNSQMKERIDTLLKQYAELQNFDKKKYNEFFSENFIQKPYLMQFMNEGFSDPYFQELNIFNLFDEKYKKDDDVLKLNWSTAFDKLNVQEIDYLNLWENSMHHVNFRNLFSHIEHHSEIQNIHGKVQWFTFYMKQVNHVFSDYQENLGNEAKTFAEEKILHFMKNHRDLIENKKPEIFQQYPEIEVLKKELVGFINKNDFLKNFLEKNAQLDLSNENNQLLEDFKMRESLMYQDFSLLNNENKKLFLQHILSEISEGKRNFDDFKTFYVDQKDYDVMKESIETFDEEKTMKLLKHTELRRDLLSFCFAKQQKFFLQNIIKLNIKESDNVLECLELFKTFNHGYGKMDNSQLIKNLQAIHYDGLEKIKDLLLDKYPEVLAHQYIGEKNNAIFETRHYGQSFFAKDINPEQQDMLISKIFNEHLFEHVDVNSKELRPLNISFLHDCIPDKIFTPSSALNVKNEILKYFKDDFNYMIFMCHFEKQLTEVLVKLDHQLMQQYEYLLKDLPLQEYKKDGRYFEASIIFKACLDEDKYINGFREMLERDFENNELVDSLKERVIFNSYGSIDDQQYKSFYFTLIENTDKFLKILIENEPELYFQRNRHRICHLDKTNFLDYFEKTFETFDMNKIYENLRLNNYYEEDTKLDAEKLLMKIIDKSLRDENYPLLRKIQLQIKNTDNKDYHKFSNLDTNFLKSTEMILEKTLEEKFILGELDDMDKKIQQDIPKKKQKI